MKAEIVSNTDQYLKIDITQFGEKFIATDGERVVVVETPEDAVEKIEEISQPQPVERGVPLENPKSGRMGWFDNTSWDDGKRGHQF